MLLNYVAGFGVIYVIFTLLNLTFSMLFGGLGSLTNSGKGLLLIKATTLYAWGSLSALWTLGFLDLNPGITALVVVPIIGACVVFLTSAQEVHNTQKRAEKATRGDDPLLEGLSISSRGDVIAYQGKVASTFRKYGGLLVWGNLALFTLALFLPVVATNVVTLWILNLVKGAIGIPVIGLILAIGGVLFAIVQAFQALLFVALMAVGLIRSKKKEAPGIESGSLSDDR